MNQILKQLISNKERAVIIRNNEEKMYPSEEIIGDMRKVKEFALFYENHAEDMELIKATAELDFVHDVNFDHDKFEGFMLGLEFFSRFFENSKEDVDLFEKELKKKSIG